MRLVCRLEAGPNGSLDLVLHRHESIPRLFTLWRPPPHLDPATRGRFLAAGRATARLNDSHLVSVLDEGVDRHGPFLVCEYVEGVSAAALLEVVRAAGERLPLDWCVTVASQIARALAAAHEGLATDGPAGDQVHGGLGLHDVILGWDGVTRVRGFGLATALGVLPPNARHGEADVASDLRALAFLVAELLTGKAPQSDPDDVLGQLPADTPRELKTLLGALLTPDAASPPRSAQVVADELAAIGRALAPDKPPDLVAPLTRWFTEQRRQIADLIERALRDDLASPRRRGALVGVLVAVALAAAFAWLALR